LECGSHATAFEGASMACALHTLPYENVEILVRMTIIGLKEKGDLSQEDFELLDREHYKVENKLLRLAQA